MPDITMCTGDGCPMAKTCYRHTAKPSEYRQSYFVTPPVTHEDGINYRCQYYSAVDVSEAVQ